MNDLVRTTEVGVLIAQRVEAVWAGGDDLLDPGAVERLHVLAGEALERVLIAHAPHVTQSHTTSSMTAFGTIGVLASLSRWSRIAIISNLGDRGLPVLYAGQTSWHRPHSVHDIVSSICFQVMSGFRAVPKRTSASGCSKLMGSMRPRARVRPK